MTMKDLMNIQDKLKYIALKTGEIIESYFFNKNFCISFKDDNSPVTDVDLAAQNYILEELAKAFPNFPIVSEELSKKENQAALSKQFFIVDPLDSTKNFATGIPIFDVSIALVYQGKPVVGVIRDPIHKITYSAIRGNGAKANENPIHVRQCRNIKDADLDLNIVRLPDKFYKPITLDIAREAKKVRYFGSAVIEICWIASGIIDAMINHDLSTWDLAACTLILEEAGGYWCDLEGVHFISFDTLEKRSIIAVGDIQLSKNILERINYWNEKNES